MARLCAIAELLSLPAILFVAALITGHFWRAIGSNGYDSYHWSGVIVLILFGISFLLLPPLLLEAFSSRRMLPPVILWWSHVAVLFALCTAALTLDDHSIYRDRFVCFAPSEVLETVYFLVPRELLKAIRDMLIHSRNLDFSPPQTLIFCTSLYSLVVAYYLYPLMMILSACVAVRESSRHNGVPDKNTSDMNP